MKIYQYTVNELDSLLSLSWLLEIRALVNEFNYYFNPFPTYIKSAAGDSENIHEKYVKNVYK